MNMEKQNSPPGYSCTKCQNLDNSQMVMCDRCDKWFHFTCVGVDGNVADYSWSCDLCETIPPPTAAAVDAATLGAHPNSTSSPTTTPQIIASTSANNRTPSLALYTSSAAFAPVSTLTASGPQRHSYAAANALLAPSSAMGSATLYPYTIQQTTKPAIMQQNFLDKTSSLCTANMQCDSERQKMLKLQLLEEEKAIQQEYLERKYKVLMQSDMQSDEQINLHQNNSTGQTTERMPTALGSENNQRVFNAQDVYPTSSQISARRSIPSELPSFNGDPEDWPMFINSFETSTSIAGFSNAENLMRLQHCLKGKARELVKSKLMLPALVPDIIRTLRLCFGRPEHILDRAINKAKTMPSPRDKLESLIEFAINVQNICATIESCGLDSHLNNPMLVKELIDKLPNHHKLSWAMCQKDERVPIVKLFSTWLYQIAEAASQVVTPVFGRGNACLNTHVQIKPNERKICVVCKIASHNVHQCENFKSLQLNQKWDVVKSQRLCRQCLNHHKGRCHKSQVCGVSGCKFKHHPLLHKTVSDQLTSKSHEFGNPQRNAQINAHHSDHNPFFRILPIRVYLDNIVVNTFAFLDEGSSVTLVDESIFDSLPIDGVPESLCLQWTGGTTRVEDGSVKTSLTVSGANNNTKFALSDVYTVKNLDLPLQSLDMSETVKRYPHLKNLPIQSYERAKPLVLIGANNWKVAVPIKIREGGWQQPIATKTRIGWAIQGGKSGNSEQRMLNIHSCACQKRDEELHDLVKSCFNAEKPKSYTMDSKIDSEAIEILKSTCRQMDGRYEVGLIWKNTNVHLPESYNNALRRLMCLHKKIVKDPSLRQKMQSQIDNLLKKGYATKITSEVMSVETNKVWYLPIFITLNPNKPDKIRLVWDAAAQSGGASLNDFLLSGPDLLTPLIDILLAFRIGKIAICGDIAEMFHRINVRESDMHAQRFLWWDKGDEPHKPSKFVMRALTFGLNCAPFIAHYVRDVNAKKFNSRYPRAVESIEKHHYVDDFIDSEDTEEGAITLAKQVSQVHAAAGFCIRNWASNSAGVLNQLSDTSTEPNFAKQWGATEKILGMYWNPINDVFKYVCRFVRLRRNIIEEDITPTKRECLQVLMSIFDPLGFLSCHTTGLKILLQDVWRSSIGWDDKLNENLFSKWCLWKSTIPLIKEVEIKRCYSLQLCVADKVELHTFVDAGEHAYSAVCYLLVKRHKNVDVNIVIAKSKVAPLKPISIPRMELQAALIGTRLAKKVRQTQRLRIDSAFWWSDSKTVLQWLRMDPRNLQQFVMHRVGEILEHTNLNEWKWVPTKCNPADFATKATYKRDMSLWFNGPEFLRHDPSHWPQCENLGPIVTSEVRRHVLVVNKTFASNSYLNTEYFSSWRRLYRAVATFILYMAKLKKRKCNPSDSPGVSYEMIQQAQRYLFKIAQQSRFNQEISSLRHGKCVEMSSKIYRLTPYLDDHGIIRCRSRIEQLSNHDDTIVLPNDHHVTLLIARSFHETFHHKFHEAVINKIKAQFHIFRLRVLYKRVRASCQRCKNDACKPKTPQMAPLPAARLGVFQRPFTYVGIDFFGPFLISIGRRREKRWGVVFTCLTIRAIHIEVAHSLDTSSCILCIRNFVARRGVPREIYTDNGTNFKGAEKILRDEVKQINFPIVLSTFDTTKWLFNPPSAPHMGGIWERLIRSIKDVLYSLYPSANFNEETLKNAMCEIESIVNSRPLTFVSVEHEDDDALTPNHLLLGSCDGYKPLFENNGDLRQRWQQTKLFADHFWKRWLKEYTPIISRRTKWFDKVPPVSIGAIVVVIDENLPRRCWPKGKIIDTVVARDGQVRRVTVKTQFGTMQRPVTKIAVLNVGVRE